MKFEVPTGHSEPTDVDRKASETLRKRWTEELRLKKSGEMEIFNGRQAVNINEGETASSISQSKVSNKAEKAAKLAQDA